MKIQESVRKFFWLGLLIFLLSCEEDFESPPLVVEAQILQLVNEHRSSIGKSALELDAYITYECRVHSKNMSKVSEISHDDFDKRVSRIKKELGGNGAGENVAAGYNSAKRVMEGWLNSSVHRANIEGNHTTIGIGAYQEKVVVFTILKYSLIYSII